MSSYLSTVLHVDDWMLPREIRDWEPGDPVTGQVATQMTKRLAQSLLALNYWNRPTRETTGLQNLRDYIRSQGRLKDQHGDPIMLGYAVHDEAMVEAASRFGIRRIAGEAAPFLLNGAHRLTAYLECAKEFTWTPMFQVGCPLDDMTTVDTDIGRTNNQTFAKKYGLRAAAQTMTAALTSEYGTVTTCELDRFIGLHLESMRFVDKHLPARQTTVRGTICRILAQAHSIVDSGTYPGISSVFDLKKSLERFCLIYTKRDRTPNYNPAKENAPSILRGAIDRTPSKARYRLEHRRWSEYAVHAFLLGRRMDQVRKAEHEMFPFPGYVA